MQKFIKNKTDYLSICLFILSIVLIIIGKYYHEPWRDELHSLCISVAAKNPIQLYYFRQYEGHPYIYYFILFITQIGGNNYFSFVAIHLIASIIVFYFLFFKMQLANSIKILLPFNYYFLFEFGTINRHYIFVILFLLLAIYYYKKSADNLILSLIFIAIAANIHVQAIAICICLAACLVYENYLQSNITKKKGILIFCVAGLFIGLSYLTCIPPKDCYNKLNGLMPNFSNFYIVVSKINFGVTTLFKNKEFCFWNESYYFNQNKQIILLAIFIIGSSYAIIKNYRKFYLVSFVIIFYMLLMLNTWGIRHYSFLWISFLIFFLIGYTKTNKFATRFITMYLIFQAATGIYAATKDYKYIFSDCKNTATQLEKITSNTNIPVFGYCNCLLDGLTFFTKKPIYFLGSKSLETYTIFKNNSDFEFDRPKLFKQSINEYLQKNPNAYFIISKGKATTLYRTLLETDTNIISNKLYSSPQQSIVEDEVYVIYKLSLKR